MTKHTPGPWFANAIAKGRIIGGAGTPGADKITINNHHATVATVYRLGDARLIQEAPAMADALRGLLKYADPYAVPGGDENVRAHDAARAILARIDGED